jgi:uncharacterized protein involved in outer membrane biogenesis
LREVLTALAVLLVLALSAILVGPWFVDWSAHRALIEAKLSETLGARVTIAGPLDLRLLPSPRLEAADIAIAGARPGDPALRIGRARLELAAAPLVKGELRFVEARLERPELDLTLGAGGALALPALDSVETARVALESLELVDGVIRLRDETGADIRRVDGLAAQLSADTLAGPFKGQGAVAGATPLTFRFSTGAIENGRLRHKIVVDESPAFPRAEFEGAIVAARAAAGVALAYDGLATLSGRIRRGTAADASGTPWRLQATLKSDAAESLLDPLELRLGEDRSVVLTGAGRLAHAADPTLELQLAAKQIDLDRLLAGEGQTAVPLEALRALAQFAGEGVGLAGPARIRLDLDPGAVTLGGETAAESRLALRFSPDEPPSGRIETQLPGRARLIAEGRFEGGAAARFRGRLDFAARDWRRLREWLIAGVADRAALPPALAADLPFAAISAQGVAEISGVSLSLRNAAFAFDRSTMKGEFAWTAAVGADRARLYADMRSDALDIDGVPDLSGLMATSSATDLSLSLDARAVRVARIGEGVLDAGRIVAQMTRTAGAVELERFSIAGLGGANLTATGALDEKGGRLDLDLDAQRLTDLTALLRRLAPGGLTDALARKAARLSPAKATLRALAGPGFQLEKATLDAALAGGKATLEAAREGEALAIRLSADHPDAAQLLRQFGAETRGVPNKGSGRLDALWRGRLDGPMSANVNARLAGAALGFDGAMELAPLVQGRAPWLRGRASLEAADATPLLQALDLVSPNLAAKGSVDVEADVETVDGALAVADLRGWAFASRVAGQARWRPPAPEADIRRPRLTGALTLDRLSLAGIAALAFGFEPGAQPAQWSQRGFGPALLDAPDTALDLAVSRFELDRGRAVDAAKLRLSIGPGLVAVDTFSGTIGGASLVGGLALRRDGAEGAVSGRLGLTGLALDSSYAKGALDLELEFAGAGRTPAAIVAGLGGEGRLTTRDLALPGLAAGAIAPVIAAADEGQMQIEEGSIERALTAGLDAGALAIGARDAPLNLAGGVLRAGPVAIEGGTSRATVSAQLDLKAMALDLRAQIAETSAPRLWTGAPPRIEAIWRGPLDAPRREIDSGPFFNGLAARQIARDLERIEALEADIRERASFVRRAKAFDFLRRREAEIASYEAEQARLAAEAERKRLEEERRAAEAERLRLEEERKQAAEAERKRIEDERKAAIEAERRRREEERLAAEAERKRLEEERRQAAEAERRRRDEERRAALEAERRRQEEARRPPAAPLELHAPVRQ